MREHINRLCFAVANNHSNEIIEIKNPAQSLQKSDHSPLILVSEQLLREVVGLQRQQAGQDHSDHTPA